MYGVSSGNSGQKIAKILIMGLAESGKSTIVQVAFEGQNPPPKDTRYDATIEYVRKTIEVDGEKLSIFDVGGQKAFLDRFTGEMAEFIFSNAKALMFVIDLTKLEELSRAKFYFDKCLKNLEQFSPDAQIYLLLHKIDLIGYDVEYYEYAIKPTLLANVSAPIDVYLTSVYDDSIYEVTKKVLGTFETTTDMLESLIVSFHAKTNARSVEVLSLKGMPVPLTRVGEVIEKLKDYESLKSNLMEAFQAVDLSGEEHGKLTGAILETDEDIRIWRKIDDHLVLTAIYPKDKSLLDIYPSVKSLTTRLGSSKKSETRNPKVPKEEE